MGPKPKAKAAPVVEDFLTNVKFTGGVDEATIRTQAIKEALKVTRQNLINIRNLMPATMLDTLEKHQIQMDKDKHPQMGRDRDKQTHHEMGKDTKDRDRQIRMDRDKNTPIPMGKEKDKYPQMGQDKDKQIHDRGKDTKYDRGKKDETRERDRNAKKVLGTVKFLRLVQTDLQGKLKELEETTKGIRDTFGIVDVDNVYDSIEPSRLDVEMCSIYPVINMKDFSVID